MNNVNSSTNQMATYIPVKKIECKSINYIESTKKEVHFMNLIIQKKSSIFWKSMTRFFFLGMLSHQNSWIMTHLHLTKTFIGVDKTRSEGNLKQNRGFFAHWVSEIINLLEIAPALELTRYQTAHLLMPVEICFCDPLLTAISQVKFWCVIRITSSPFDRLKVYLIAITTSSNQSLVLKIFNPWGIRNIQNADKMTWVTWVQVW